MPAVMCGNHTYVIGLASGFCEPCSGMSLLMVRIFSVQLWVFSLLTEFRTGFLPLLKQDHTDRMSCVECHGRGTCSWGKIIVYSGKATMRNGPYIPISFFPLHANNHILNRNSNFLLICLPPFGPKQNAAWLLILKSRLSEGICSGIFADVQTSSEPRQTHETLGKARFTAWLFS